MKRFFASVALSVVVMLFGSCCDCIKGSPKIGDLEAARWVLVDFQNEAVASSGIYLTFDGAEKMIYGEAKCNNFFAGYSLDSEPTHNIKVGAVGGTLRECGDVDTTVERGFAAALQSITVVRIEGDNLLMLNAEGSLVAVFEHAK